MRVLRGILMSVALIASVFVAVPQASAADGDISTVAGGGVDRLYEQFVFDADGNFFATNRGRTRVLRVDANTGESTLIAGAGVEARFADLIADGSLAVDAQFGTIGSMAVAPDGSLYIANFSSIYRVDTDGIIHHVAGNGLQGSGGDGGPAVNARVYLPTSLVLDDDGNLYFGVFTGPHATKVRKVDTNGIITTVAGTGAKGFGGDGGQAVDALLDGIGQIAVDAGGNVYIASDGRVRKVDVDGIISTVAGTGVQGFAGDGGPAVDAELSGPSGVVVDADGTIYVSDAFNNRVRRVSIDGTITTIAGTGNQGRGADSVPAIDSDLDVPRRLFVDDNENLWIHDGGNQRFRLVDAAGVITSPLSFTAQEIASDVPATSVTLYRPRDVATDAAGNLYIAQTGDSIVRKVDTNGIITTIAGTGVPGSSADGGPAIAAELDSPVSIAVDSVGNVFIVELPRYVSHRPVVRRIRKVDTNGIISTVATAEQLGTSGGSYQLAVDGADNLYVAHRDRGRVYRIDTDGIITTVAGTGSNSFSGDGGPATRAGIHVAAVDVMRLATCTSPSPVGSARSTPTASSPRLLAPGYKVLLAKVDLPSMPRWRIQGPP